MLLEAITFDKTVFVLSAIGIFILIFFLWHLVDKNKDKYHAIELDNEKQKGANTNLQTELEKVIAEMKGMAQDEAVKYFNEWKEKELLDYRKSIDESGRQAATALLSQWMIENETRIRKDAANRSVRNVMGRVAEHLIPFSYALQDFNPKDMRFIGSPIDLIIFDGAEELDKEQMTIWFIEVKTGTSALSPRQKIIKEAVDSGRIKWLRVNIKDFGDEVNAALDE